MRNLLAITLAAMLALSGHALAADRPVGPETGQARTSEGPSIGPNDPDDAADFIPVPREPGEIWAGCPSGPLGALCRWMQDYERNNGPIGF